MHKLIVGDFSGDGRDDLLLQADDGLHHDAIALAQGRAELLLRFRSATDSSGVCCRIVSLGIHLIWQR